MKKAMISILLALALIVSTTVAAFAVDDVGYSIGNDPIIIKPLVDDVGY